MPNFGVGFSFILGEYMSKFLNSFSEETWFQKYKFGTDNCVQDTWKRVAKDLASVEKDKEKWEKKFYDIMDDFKFVPGGRITSNAGTGLKGTTYINCFVSGVTGNDCDSVEGIYNEVMKQAQILKSEGGYGFCCNFMRPKGAHIGGIANQSPGSIKFLELWDKSSEIITAGSGQKSKKNEKNFIRKGAQMVTMSCWHPDVIEFIEAKKTPGRLSKFNMSVLCTDSFMESVKMDSSWKLVFPNYEKYGKQYKEIWNGDINAWIQHFSSEGQTPEDILVVYHEFESARDLWNLIMDNTYNRNEPGVLFIDTMNKMNNLYYCEHINATNPCGEQILPIGGVCLLGSINLVHFIDPQTKSWKFEPLKDTIHTAVRFMDNVNDKTNVPLPEQKQNLKNKRRIGLGVMGYGSALLMAKIQYGSKQALKMTEELMKFFTNEAYRASVDLAREKGAFPLLDKEEYLNGKFVANLDEDIIYGIKKHGIRNSHLTSIQPTGNSSCFANCVSGGLEPIFMHEYIRTSIQPSAPEGLPVPKNINWSAKTFDLSHNSTNVNWKWAKEGDEDLLVTKFENKIWKFDRTRGLLKEELIEDYGVKYLKGVEDWNPNANWAKTTISLNVDEHIDTMAIFAKWIDSAISKTVNLPNEYSYDEFKDVYKKCWEKGIKGFTTYRAGTMTAVLSEKSTSENVESTKNQERPKELECDVHHIRVKGGEEYFVLIGLNNGEPYEVFAGKNGFIAKEVKKGTIIKMNRPKGVYKCIMDNDLEICPINASCTAEEDALTRMTSTALRSGANIQMIYEQLNKVKGDMHCFAKSMARALKYYIKDGSQADLACPSCSEMKLIYTEGCVKCTSCGFSGCS